MRETFTIVETKDPEAIVVTRRSLFTDTDNSLVLPLSAEAFHTGVALWNEGTLVQIAFPTLSPGQREFLQTGATPEEWENTFGDDDKE
jgi:hypothetical protein